ncbi:hypothetical protein D3C71_1928740 [compost metagenome]
MVYVAMLLTVKRVLPADLLTSMSGESPISPKLLSSESPPSGNTIWLIAEGTVSRPVATPVTMPSTAPALVMPLRVCGGWVGSVTV